MTRDLTVRHAAVLAQHVDDSLVYFVELLITGHKFLYGKRVGSKVECSQFMRIA